MKVWVISLAFLIICVLNLHTCSASWMCLEGTDQNDNDTGILFIKSAVSIQSGAAKIWKEG